MFVDTHTHLNFRQFDKDIDSVIDRALLVGVNRMIIVGSDLANSIKAIGIASKNNHLYATVGLHPIHVTGVFGMAKDDNLPPSIWTDDYESKFGRKINLNDIENLCRSDKVVALGEIGLDYHTEREKPRINKEIQKASLEGLIDLGLKMKIPMIFHCRKAAEDFFDIAKPRKRLAGVMHCFQGDVVDAKRVLDLGLLISFTGLVTFCRDYDEIIEYLPLDRIMIETDCPFLTPEPHRGQRNEPSFVVEVARRISEIKDIPLYKVAEETTRNAVELFKLNGINNWASAHDSRETMPKL